MTTETTHDLTEVADNEDHDTLTTHDSDSGVELLLMPPSFQ